MTVRSHERGTPCTLICTANALEQGDLEPERAVTQQTRSEGGTMLASPGGKMFTQPRRSACWMPCCICCHGRLISTSFPSARKKMEKKGCKVYSESLIYL